MISKLLTPILNRLGYIHWSQLDQPETGSLEKRKAEQAEIKAFIINGFDSEKLECCPWVKGWLDAQEEYFWHLSHLKRTGRANPLFKHNNQPSSEGVWLGAVQIQYTLLRAVTYCFSSFALKDESRSLSEDEAVKLGELALNIHKATRHTSTVRLPSGLDDMDWIQSIHSEIKGELLGEIQSLLSNSPMGMDAEKLWCRVLVNEVYYQVYGLLNIPPYKPHDFLISSISDFKNPRKVKYAASAPTYSFPFDLYPASELEKNLRFVDRNGRLVNSDTLFEWSSK